jgi:hypothetical protein
MRTEKRNCGACGAARPATEAPDPCLGTLPGIYNACCGHGFREYAYLQWPDGTRVGGDAAHQGQIALGGKPWPLVSEQRWVPMKLRWPRRSS